jgi:hypothetical protein
MAPVGQGLVQRPQPVQCAALAKWARLRQAWVRNSIRFNGQAAMQRPQPVQLGRWMSAMSGKIAGMRQWQG